MSAELVFRVQQIFDRCKEFPEAGKQGDYFLIKGDAYMALIELRSMCPDIVRALGRQESAKSQPLPSDIISN